MHTKMWGVQRKNVIVCVKHESDGTCATIGIHQWLQSSKRIDAPVGSGRHVDCALLGHGR